MKKLVTFLTVMLCVTVTAVAQQRACNSVIINSKGTSNADITVDSTAGGVTVLDANNQRCSAIIIETAGNQIRCAPANLTVTTTVGFPLKAFSDVAGLNLSERDGVKLEWKCIRTGASSGTVSVMEVRE